MICSICNKKQSGFIGDFPLSNTLSDKRTCTVCNDHKNALQQYCTHDFKRYCAERDYFAQLIEKANLDGNVAEYINDLLTECNLKANDFENKRVALETSKQQEIYNTKAIYNDFTTTTGYNFEGYSIVKYNKTICAETVLGTGFISEFSAGLADFFGVESNKLATKFEDAREAATIRLIDKALSLQANAIIGLSFNYAPIAGNMIALIISGTAVTIQKN